MFLKAADLAAGLGARRSTPRPCSEQSRAVHQAEIDSAAELVDLALQCRLHAADTGRSADILAGRLEPRRLPAARRLRPCASPFHFTAIAANLPCAPALMGNTVVEARRRRSSPPTSSWNPAGGGTARGSHQPRLWRRGRCHQRRVLGSPALPACTLTGSTAVFGEILRRVKEIPAAIAPSEVVGETGGKNFVLAHASCDVEALAVGIIRGGFEYQGQKCSAASRVFDGPAMAGARAPQRRIAAIRVGDVAPTSAISWAR